MRATLLPLLRGPASGTPLEFEGELQPWIEEGILVSPQSGRHYAIKRGMAYLYVDDEIWQPKAREAVGWVKYHQDHNIYDQAGVDIDFQLPYFPHEPWTDIAQQFDIALAITQPQPGAWVLDIGAGRGWAAKHFAMRGCNAVAVDIVDDDQVGLGRSRALMQQAGVVYDTLIADSERLPFAASSFDLVFCAAALHHTTDLNCLVRNIGRVLKPGGRMIAINEPCVSEHADDAELRRTALAEELSYGINETRPRLKNYRCALHQAGLQEQTIFRTYAVGALYRIVWA
jgi:SAM-dependent methyltransferase